LCLLSLQGIWSARQKRPRAGVRIPSRAWYAREPIPPMADRLMGDTPRWSAPGPLCATTAPCGRAGPGGRRPAAAGAFCESLREGGGPATGDDKGGGGGVGASGPQRKARAAAPSRWRRPRTRRRGGGGGRRWTGGPPATPSPPTTPPAWSSAGTLDNDPWNAAFPPVFACARVGGWVHPNGRTEIP